MREVGGFWHGGLIVGGRLASASQFGIIQRGGAIVTTWRVTFCNRGSNNAQLRGGIANHRRDGACRRQCVLLQEFLCSTERVPVAQWPNTFATSVN